MPTKTHATKLSRSTTNSVLIVCRKCVLYNQTGVWWTASQLSIAVVHFFQRQRQGDHHYLRWGQDGVFSEDKQASNGSGSHGEFKCK